MWGASLCLPFSPFFVSFGYGDFGGGDAARFGCVEPAAGAGAGPPCGDGPARLPLWQSQGSQRQDATPPVQHRPQTLVRPGLATPPAGTPKSPILVCGLLT